MLSLDPPLLGTATSVSSQVGTNVNNPGPLLFDLLALPVTLFPGRAGIAVGVALLNCAAIIGLTIVAHRQGGAPLAVAAAGTAALLSFTMGSELLIQPWQPHSLLLPFLLYLILVWGISAGDGALLPWAAGVGSLLLQTHLSYVLLVVALGGWALVTVVLRARRARHGRGAHCVSLRTCVAALLVLVACWTQPVAEELVEEDGNLERLAGISGGPLDTLGPGDAVRVLADVVVTPPWTSLRTLSLRDAHSTGTALVSLFVLAAVLCGCALRARRRGDALASQGVGAASVTLATGLFTLWRTPPSALFKPFGLATHHVLWLWPITAFVLLVLLRAVVGKHLDEHRLVVALAALTVALAAVNLPTRDRGASQPDWALPVQRDLDSELGALVGCGPLLLDAPTYGIHFDTAIMAELQRRDIEFVVEDPVLVRQLGASRAFDGDNASAVLHVRIGDGVEDPPDGSRPVARRDGLDPRQRRLRDQLADRIRTYAQERGQFPLSDNGKVAVEAGMGAGALPAADTLAPAELFPADEVGDMVRVMLDFTVLDDHWQDELRRFAELDERWQRETVGLSLSHHPAGEPPDGGCAPLR